MMEPPTWVKNKDSWRKQCRRLARAKELIAGKIGLTEAAHKIHVYQTWLRAEGDPDFMIFGALFNEVSRHPTGAVREHWVLDALEKEDIEIRAIEAKFQIKAIEAAHNLVKKYGVNEPK